MKLPPIKIQKTLEKLENDSQYDEPYIHPMTTHRLLFTLDDPIIPLWSHKSNKIKDLSDNVSLQENSYIPITENINIFDSQISHNLNNNSIQTHTKEKQEIFNIQK
jgi:hypothetical protein